jgi:hypothetical protein
MARMAGNSFSKNTEQVGRTDFAFDIFSDQKYKTSSF